MAAQKYYMLVNNITKTISRVHTEEMSEVESHTQYSATFSQNSEDNPEVVTYFRRPLPGGVFLHESNTYYAPGEICLMTSWEGDIQIAEDGVPEIQSNGTNQARITFQKFNDKKKTAINGQSESFGVYISGAMSSDQSVGRISLDEEGKVDFTFTPPNTIKGEVDIQLRPINNNICGQSRLRII